MRTGVSAKSNFTRWHLDIKGRKDEKGGKKTLQKHVRSKKPAQVNQFDRKGTHKEVTEARTRGVTKQPYWKAEEKKRSNELNKSNVHADAVCARTIYITHKLKILKVLKP